MNAKSKLKELPKQPGVYFFMDGRKKIIYVGKAANLKSRVSSYFQKSRVGDWKLPVLVNEIADLEWMVCASEIDALFLESELIKRYQPKYNVDLKDEKSHLYLKVTLRDVVPTVSLVRRPLDDGATYLGPYIDAGGLRRALRYLRRIFPYNTHTVLPKRVCLQYHLGLCPGMEEGKTDIADYRRNLGRLMMFLKGQRTLLVKQLEKEMAKASKTQDYERAAMLRNQSRSLRALSKQIVFGEAERFDLTADQALNGLQELLGLNGLPRRIETYDISHLSGTHNVASMVVFIDGVAAKSEYRKFHMKRAGNDDFAHMREVITRRFSSQAVNKWPKPDLLVIDGGKGQLTAALEALETKGVTIPAIGLAKRLEEVVRTAQGPKPQAPFEIIRLDKDSAVLKLLQRMRDEAHRFAVAYHSLLRSKQQSASQLEDIPGIGPASRKKLIRRFGSLRGLKTANQQQVAEVIGPVKARQLLQHLAS